MIRKEEGKKDENRLDRNYKWIAKAAKRECKKGRVKRGVIVGIKKGIKIRGVKK